MSSVSVVEAAAMLGVHPQRVHQRIREGSLAAVKIGNQWVVEANDVRRVKHHHGPGRPLSSKSAWDLLAVASGGEAAADLNPAARSRARSRLRELLANASSANLDDAAAHIAHALRNRAERHLLMASSRDLPDLRDDDRVHLSGISLPQSRMSAGDVAEGYVSLDNLHALSEDYLLSRAHQSRANVILHVVPAAAEHPALAALDDLARSALALAADLAEHDGLREKGEAVRSLVDLEAQLLAGHEHG